MTRRTFGLLSLLAPLGALVPKVLGKQDTMTIRAADASLYRTPETIHFKIKCDASEALAHFRSNGKLAQEMRRMLRAG